MKKSIYLTLGFLLALLCFSALPVQAQMTDNGYANIDWQYNFPLHNHFADDNSGWGMNLEGGYFFTDHCSLGAFLAYHTNHEYVSRQTLPVASGGCLNTDQQHTLFQLPFGLSARYTCVRGGDWQPYFGVRLGAQYAQLKSDFNVFQEKDDTWGFYCSPEIGVTYYPCAFGPGIHLSLYYSYATNQATVMTVHQSNLNNFGFRVGLAF